MLKDVIVIYSSVDACMKRDDEISVAEAQWGIKSKYVSEASCQSLDFAGSVKEPTPVHAANERQCGFQVPFFSAV